MGKVVKIDAPTIWACECGCPHMWIYRDGSVKCSDCEEIQPWTANSEKYATMWKETAINQNTLLDFYYERNEALKSDIDDLVDIVEILWGYSSYGKDIEDRFPKIKERINHALQFCENCHSRNLELWMADGTAYVCKECGFEKE